MFRSLPIVLGGVLLLLSACAAPVGFEIRSKPDANSQVSAFNQALFADYWPDAAFQAGVDDTFSSDLFAKKAKAANSGSTVLPEEVDTQIGPNHKGVHESQVGDLTDARARLMAFIDRGAREIRPSWTSKAQVAFDCWVEESTERDSRGGILERAAVEACKSDFNTAMAKIEPFLPPEHPAERMKMFDLMPDQGGPPAPAMAGAPDTYLVFFDWDKSNLTPEALGIIRTAAANAKKTGTAKIEVTGHADRSGQPDYNMRLSKRRADAVKGELVKQGVPAANITVYAKGETEPLVPTPDGVREPQNRRAQIVIRTR
jgi:outer membrane protein OmpA-like peptidoglycan-associated protein